MVHFEKYSIYTIGQKVGVFGDYKIDQFGMI